MFTWLFYLKMYQYFSYSSKRIANNFNNYNKFNNSFSLANFNKCEKKVGKTAFDPKPSVFCKFNLFGHAYCLQLNFTI